MNGKDLVNILEEPEFSIQIGGVTKHQWRKKKEISPAILRNALRKLRAQTLDHAIKPAIEFHCLDFEHDANTDSFRNRLNDEQAYKTLKDITGGIYAFFDSTGEIIYVGKTAGNLFSEMEQRYSGKKIKFRVIKNGRASWKQWPIKHVAQFASAYSVSDALITNMEALLTWIIINKASNIRTESFKKSAINT
jgi:hypothetical protein